MKEAYLLIACILLFAGCASEENTAKTKETAHVKQETTKTTASENYYSSTTQHEHDPNKKCSYSDDAFSACDGKANGELCEYNSTGAIVSGKCAAEPCGKVVCKT